MADRSSPDPNRARDETRAAENISGQLIERGVRLFGNESPEELGDLIDEVERFEEATATYGADSMTNAPDSTRPDDRRLVLPERHDDESIVRYAARVNAAAEEVRRAVSARDRR